MEITNFYSNENVHDCPINKHPEYAFIGRFVPHLFAPHYTFSSSDRKGERHLYHIPPLHFYYSFVLPKPPNIIYTISLAIKYIQ